jgi:hypothetical protein
MSKYSLDELELNILEGRLLSAGADFSKLIPFLFFSIRELKQEIDELKKRVTQLENPEWDMYL